MSHLSTSLLELPYLMHSTTTFPYELLTCQLGLHLRSSQTQHSYNLPYSHREFRRNEGTTTPKCKSPITWLLDQEAPQSGRMFQ